MKPSPSHCAPGTHWSRQNQDLLGNQWNRDMKEHNGLSYVVFCRREVCLLNCTITPDNWSFLFQVYMFRRRSPPGRWRQVADRYLTHIMQETLCKLPCVLQTCCMVKHGTFTRVANLLNKPKFNMHSFALKACSLHKWNSDRNGCITQLSIETINAWNHGFWLEEKESDQMLKELAFA